MISVQIPVFYINYPAIVGGVGLFKYIIIILETVKHQRDAYIMEQAQRIRQIRASIAHLLATVANTMAMSLAVSQKAVKPQWFRLSFLLDGQPVQNVDHTVQAKQ